MQCLTSQLVLVLILAVIYVHACIKYILQFHPGIWSIHFMPTEPLKCWAFINTFLKAERPFRQVKIAIEINFRPFHYRFWVDWQYFYVKKKTNSSQTRKGKGPMLAASANTTVVPINHPPPPPGPMHRNAAGLAPGLTYLHLLRCTVPPRGWGRRDGSRGAVSPPAVSSETKQFHPSAPSRPSHPTLSLSRSQLRETHVSKIFHRWRQERRSHFLSVPIQWFWISPDLSTG